MLTKKKHHLKSSLILIGIVSILAFSMIIATTPIHEGGHWVMSEYFDPYIKPVEFHVLDETSFNNGEHLLTSALGCIIVEEAYPGALHERPAWADALQEIICVLVQIIITCIVILKVLQTLIDRHPWILTG